MIISFHGSGAHGGTTVNKATGPDFLLYHDNIVVFVEHRIQMYGFLNLGGGDYTGNMGLKDQQLALKWINRNIEQFSGNKNQILLYGQSWGNLMRRTSFTKILFLIVVAKILAKCAQIVGASQIFYKTTVNNHL